MLEQQYSRPPNTAALWTGEKTAVFENSGKGSHVQPRKYIFVTWKSAAVLGEGRQRRGSIGGTTVLLLISKSFPKDLVLKFIVYMRKLKSSKEF